ncbi:SDR family oxidoreductase [Mycolicibacterium hodleri]|uniref:NAD-dependent epimerase/dehydratase family protein n=1 Tax=Mycolicibacterium hodleri TaxID=49897 RepID=A0A502DJU7_9MYCO|nr:NmrA family NAD(P)-binding protein [Mycolicibacterium hodleri]TPG25578.1 NAD-dependent epimerase/dehydratase family protein [Mycolicibacterium hodleri]
MKVLATGSTGKFANLVVRALIAQGVDVRALVHDPDKADVPRRHGATDITKGDMSQPATLTAALADVDGVFVITPAFAPDATQMALNVIDAAHRAGVRKIVYNGVYHPSLSLSNHAGTRPVEEALYHSDIDFTILQPAMYMQNLAGPFNQAKTTGTVVMPWSQNSKMTYVDYRDVAEVAASAFTADRLSYGTFELAAPGMLSRVELAELMTNAVQRSIAAAEPMPAPQTSDQLDGLGAMFADYDGFGFHGGNALVLRTILGREPRSVAAFLAEQATP